MTEHTRNRHPCLPGGLIPLDQWRVPETSVRRTLRSALRDILDQLKAGIHPDDQAFKSLDDLPALSEYQLSRYAPVPDGKVFGRELVSQLESLDRNGGQSRRCRVLVAPPYSGVAEALRCSGKRVIVPPENLLMTESEIVAWWDDQLGEAGWVIPELADFWIRHRLGLGLVRELLARVAMDQVGEGIVGCSSWCWHFWGQFLPDLYLAPLTPGPLTADRLSLWLEHLAGDPPAGKLVARMTRDGSYVLPAPSGEEGDRKYSEFARDLATLSRGNPGVALAIWRRTLRARPEEDADKKDDGTPVPVGRQCWVAPLDQLSLPAVPQSSTSQSGHIIHALLLHNGLTVGQLALAAGLSGQALRVALARLQRADVVVVGEDGVYQVSPLAYPGVRRYLQSKGYPVDGF